MRALALAPHTDDAEFGCGGTLARLRGEDAEVRVVAFSRCDDPQLCEEAVAAAEVLDVSVRVMNYPVRRFHERRQEILDHMINLCNWQPDVVFTPARRDVHQDHQVVTAEAIRAFRKTTILGYELPWNSLSFDNQLFVRLNHSHVVAKAAAVECFQSQRGRHYASYDAVSATCRAMGIHIGCEYAEGFEVYRATL